MIYLGGSNTVYSCAGNDTIRLTSAVGYNQVTDSGGTNTISSTTTAGANTVSVGAGNDIVTMKTGAGVNRATDTGTNLMSGGEGNDIYRVDHSAGVTAIEDNEGENTLWFADVMALLGIFVDILGGLMTFTTGRETISVMADSIRNFIFGDTVYNFTADSGFMSTDMSASRLIQDMAAFSPLEAASGDDILNQVMQDVNNNINDVLTYASSAMSA